MTRPLKSGHLIACHLQLTAKFGQASHGTALKLIARSRLQLTANLAASSDLALVTGWAFLTAAEFLRAVD
jgi:hypothetical protein